MSYKLILLRHGESEWNAKNLFTGWVDVALSDKGRAEAARGGQLLKEAKQGLGLEALVNMSVNITSIIPPNCSTA